MIKDETGYAIEDLFEEFDSNPIGAGTSLLITKFCDYFC